MALPVTFPPQDFFDRGNQLSLFSFSKKSQIPDKIEKICDKIFKTEKLFKYASKGQTSDQTMFKCTNKICVAYILYEKRTNARNKIIYIQKKFLNIHTHRPIQFREISSNLLKPYLKIPKIINYPCSNEQAKTNKYTFPEILMKLKNNSENINQILDYLHEDWGKIYGNEPLLFVSNNDYKPSTSLKAIYCRQSHKTNTITKCKWKMMFRKIGPEFLAGQEISENLQKKGVNQQKPVDNKDISKENTRKQSDQDIFMISLSESNFEHTHYAFLQCERNQFYKQIENQYPEQFKKIKECQKPKEQAIQEQNPPKSNQFEMINFLKQGREGKIKQAGFNIENNIIYIPPQASQVNVNRVPPLHQLLARLLLPLEGKGFCYKFISRQQTERVLVLLAKNGKMKKVNESYTIQEKTIKDKKYNIDLEDGEQIEKTQDALDYQDIVIISSKIMRYLCRNYGEVVYITQISPKQLSQDQNLDKKPDVLTNIIFSSFNYYQKLVFLGAGFCRNLTLQKLSKILLIFIKHHLKSVKTLIINQKQQNLLFIARKLKIQKKYKFNIVTIPRKSIQNTKIGSKFTVNDEYQKYVDITHDKQSTLKRQKIYDTKLNIDKKIEPKIFIAGQKNLKSQEEKQDQNSIRQDNGQNWHPYLDDCFIGSSSLFWQETGIIIKRCLNSIQKDFNNMQFASSHIHNIVFFHQFNLILFEEISKRNSLWCLRESQRQYIQIYYQYPQLVSCRYLLGKYLFEKLTYQVMLVQKCSVLVNQTNFCLIDDGLTSCTVQMVDYDNYLNHGILKLHSLRNQFNYSSDGQKQTCICECGYKQVVGIPCCHILMVMLNRRFSLLQSIKLSNIINMGIVRPRQKGYFKNQKKTFKK